MLRRRSGIALALLLAATLASAAKPAPPWSGHVTHVSDGDSLWVQPADAALPPVEIRLVEIDAPEICQAYGPQARVALQERVGGRTVDVRSVGRDGFGRTLARVALDGADVGAWLVQEGHAWSQRTRWNRGPLVKQETQARALQRGLHREPGAITPKEFRRQHGPCERASTGRAQ